MSEAQVHIIVSPTPAFTVTTGMQGPPGPAGDGLIGDYRFIPNQLIPGDHVEFTGAAWTNVHKTTLSDGGNF